MTNTQLLLDVSLKRKPKDIDGFIKDASLPEQKDFLDTLEGQGSFIIGRVFLSIAGVLGREDFFDEAEKHFKGIGSDSIAFFEMSNFLSVASDNELALLRSVVDSWQKEENKAYFYGALFTQTHNEEDCKNAFKYFERIQKDPLEKIISFVTSISASDVSIILAHLNKHQPIFQARMLFELSRRKKGQKQEIFDYYKQLPNNKTKSEVQRWLSCLEKENSNQEI